MATNDHFCWMDKSDNGQFSVPLIGDPLGDDAYPADELFDTREDAIEYRDERIEWADDDDAEQDYIRSWILCRRTITEVEQPERLHARQPNDT